ncbi:MAG TPA: phage holin [Candidatus Acutalibacter pullistercoris]|uniref:Phage holin n=1 Tax=Candidatus Acutalibacter pullistercoris TaxID=2838418 RepID=A0A9D2C051_9FIRM|nr:phage holin [Candidatus Acutalibacter pullistercoris]
MKINWSVRVRNKTFWLAVIPAALLLIQAVGEALGFPLELGGLGDKLLGVVNALFALLALLGVVNDPTTQGTGDSQQALGYQVPKGKEG